MDLVIDVRELGSNAAIKTLAQEIRALFLIYAQEDATRKRKLVVHIVDCDIPRKPTPFATAAWSNADHTVVLNFHGNFIAEIAFRRLWMELEQLFTGDSRARSLISDSFL